MHTQFLKRILGCNYSTSNIMTRGEVGSRPLLVEIIKKVLMYINSLKARPSAIANKAISFEYTNDNSPNITKFIDKFKLDGLPANTPSKYKINKICSGNYDTIWKAELALSPKADSYVLYKNINKLECYTHQIKSVKHRIALSRFRLSNHPLMIEKGRHIRPRIERSERKCFACINEIEDEIHFMTQCHLYNEERLKLYDACRRNSINFDHIPTNEQIFTFILSNESDDITQATAKFIYNSLKLRESMK